MKKIIALTALVFAFIFIITESASAVWVWTPKTKKWENPKYSSRGTPKLQFEFAMSYFNAADYKSALREFRKLLKVYPNSEFAPDAQYYIGGCYQRLEQYYESFQAYQKVIETYPYNERVDEIIGEQYNIGKIFYDGYKSKIFGIPTLPSIDKAVEVFGKVVENSPYGKYADSTQYYLGLSYKKMFQYKEAVDALKKLLDEYPQSPLVEDAKFQIGQCYAETAAKPGYDQENTEKSIGEFKELLEINPDSAKAKEAAKFVDVLRERKAESIFSTAKFYERLGKYESAQIYYRQILDEYPKTTHAALALERLEVLKAKGKIK